MEYTTERGVTIDIVPIPLLLEEVRKAHPDVEPLTYVETLAGGVEQDVEITDEMAAAAAEENPDWWAERADAWAAYKAKVAERDEKVNAAIWKATLLKAIRVELPKDDNWIRDQEDLGLTVPADARAMRQHYIQTEVIGGTRDMLRITAIANGADLNEEALAQAEASFRDFLQGTLADGIAAAAR